MAESRIYRNSLQIGSMLLEYRLESVLGAGGFGMTYLGWDTHLEKHVAIKEYLPIELSVRALDGSVVPITTECEHDYKWGLERFNLEARTLAKFSHPHIVRVNRYFEANQTGYMVMDYENGEPLNQVLKREQPDERRLKEILMPLLDGLQAVHAAGFLHRDIKPGNIFLRASGSPVLIDFGAARHAIGGATKSLTSVLTPGYAPLEQYASDGNQGPWSDIYAMGGVLYRSLVNDNPPDAVSRMKNDDVPAKLGEAHGKAGEPFLRAVGWALALDEKQRPQSVDEWRRALAGESAAPAFTATPITAAQAAPTVRSGDRSIASAPTRPLTQPPVSAPPPVTAPPRARPPEASGSGLRWLGIVIVLVVALVALSAWNKQREAKDRAQQEAAKADAVRAATAREEAERLAAERLAAERMSLEQQRTEIESTRRRMELERTDAERRAGEQRSEELEAAARRRAEDERRLASLEKALKKSEQEKAAFRDRTGRERDDRPPPDDPAQKIQQFAAQEFRSADANGDGYLDRNEAARFPFIMKEFQRVDAYGDGRISLQEFIRMRMWQAEQKFRKP